MAIKIPLLRKYLLWGLILGVFGGYPTNYLLRQFPGEDLPRIQEELQIVKTKLNSLMRESNLTKEKMDGLRKSLAVKLDQVKTLGTINDDFVLTAELDRLETLIQKTSREYNNLKIRFNDTKWERRKQVGSVSVPVGATLGVGLGAAAFALRRRKEQRSKGYRVPR